MPQCCILETGGWSELVSEAGDRVLTQAGKREQRLAKGMCLTYLKRSSSWANIKTRATSNTYRNITAAFEFEKRIQLLNGEFSSFTEIICSNRPDQEVINPHGCDYEKSEML